MAALGDAAVLVVAPLTAVLHDHAGAALAVAHAGQHDGARALRGQRVEQRVDVALVVFGAELSAGEEAGLGDVRQNEVGREGEALHGLDVIEVESRVELSVVRHGRVDDGESAVGQERREDVLHIGDLLPAAEVAGVDRVKRDVLLPPVRGDAGDVLGQIAHGKARKARRVRAQHGRGQNAGLEARGGEDRQRDGQRALADAGDVLDGEDLWIRHFFISSVNVNLQRAAWTDNGRRCRAAGPR